MEKSGEKFIHQKDSELHTTKPVEYEQKRRKRAGEKTTQKPAEKIADWLKVVEKTHMGHRDDPRVMERIKKYYHKENVIKPEDVPESYFENQRRMAREQGHGDIELTDEMREQLIEVIIADQESTLDNWVEYFTHPDSDSFPTWAKYWAFNGMLKLSNYDKEKHAFRKRTKDTVAPFSDLNREALAYVVDAVVKKARNEKVKEDEDNSEFQKLLQGSNFGKLYAYAIEKVTPTEQNELIITTGEWVKYDKGSDHMPLVESLQGHGTGWCTAGEETAREQLEKGDFYVYYSHNKQGEPTIPRVAIRMEDDEISEIRGIAHEQNLDQYIGEVVREKLKEFPDGERYQKKTKDMERLTKIGHKIREGGDCTKEDLRFLYEIDDKIEGFGYERDPRIVELIEERDIKKDLAIAIDCSEGEISVTEKEAMEGGIKYHYGNLDLRNLTSAEGLILPESIDGSLDLRNLTSAEGLILPNYIGDSLLLNNLISAKNLVLPQLIGSRLYINNLKSAESITLPEFIGGFGVEFESLCSVKKLICPKSIHGNLDLRNLTSAEGLILPESIDGSLDLRNLTSAEGLVLPKNIDGSLDLYSLTSAEGLILPESINGNLDLRNLTSAEGLLLPKFVGGNLMLEKVYPVEGLTLPEFVNGGIYLDSLTYVEKQELGKKFPNLRGKIVNI